MYPWISRTLDFWLQFCEKKCGLYMDVYGTVEPQLSGLFFWSQFGHEYLLVTIKIRNRILFKTTALKGAVKCEGFCSQRAKAALALVVRNEEHSNEF